MQGKIITDVRQTLTDHKLWKGQSGSIYIEDNSGRKVCLIPVGSGPVVGHAWASGTNGPWEPFFGKIELSE